MCRNSTAYLFFVVTCLATHAQTSTQLVKYPDESKNLTLLLKSQACFYSGEKPEVKLHVGNRMDREMPLPDGLVHVECDGQEAPTTLLQRQWTHTQHSGEPELMPTGYRPFISPTDIFVTTYQLSYFYDLTRPGRCTAYIDVLDVHSEPPLQLRSNVVHFNLKPNESRPTAAKTAPDCKNNEKVN